MATLARSHSAEAGRAVARNTSAHPTSDLPPSVRAPSSTVDTPARFAGAVAAAILLALSCASLGYLLGQANIVGAGL